MQSNHDRLEKSQKSFNDLPKVESVLAKVLCIREEDVTNQLEYQSIMEWDSLAHVNLMIALEQAYEIKIGVDFRAELISVAAIRAYVQQQFRDEPQVETTSVETNETTTIHRGLSGVVLDRTRTSCIDGKAGKLFYRGYSIHDLVMHASYEEVAYLLLYGKLPAQAELNHFCERLQAARQIPDSLVDMIRIMKNARPIEVLRTSVSALAAFDVDSQDTSPPAFQEKAIRLIAQIPVIITTHQAIRNGKEIVHSDPSLSHAANFLYMMHGVKPSARAAEVMDKVFILHADHGANASAFATRVVTGARSDMFAALTAAVSAFAGALHGGAVENVMTMLQEIGEPSRAADYVAQRMAKNEPIMGFGHRVYQTADPRAAHLHKLAHELSSEAGDTTLWETIEAVFDAMRPYAEKGLDVNVDFYASIIYHELDLPRDLFVATFAGARMPGWIAQIQEQLENNILIRPLLHYVGEVDLPFVPIEQRKSSADGRVER